jgi:hypothetical protein
MDMKISENMNLSELAERMGPDATEAEASHMRAALDGMGRWENTEEVSEAEWLGLCEGAVAQAKLD